MLFNLISRVEPYQLVDSVKVRKRFLREHLQELHGCRSARGLNRMVNFRYLTGEILIFSLKIFSLKKYLYKKQITKVSGSEKDVKSL